MWNGSVFKMGLSQHLRYIAINSGLFMTVSMIQWDFKGEMESLMTIAHKLLNKMHRNTLNTIEIAKRFFENSENGLNSSK